MSNTNSNWFSAHYSSSLYFSSAYSAVVASLEKRKPCTTTVCWWFTHCLLLSRLRLMLGLFTFDISTQVKYALATSSQIQTFKTITLSALRLYFGLKWRTNFTWWAVANCSNLSSSLRVCLFSVAWVRLLCGAFAWPIQLSGLWRLSRRRDSRIRST